MAAPARKPDFDPLELHTIKTIADRAKVSEKTIRRCLGDVDETKRLGHKLIRGAIRITEEQYRDWLRRNQG